MSLLWIFCLEDSIIKSIGAKKKGKENNCLDVGVV